MKDEADQARDELIANVDHPTRGGSEAIENYLRKTDAMGFPFALHPSDIAETIVDAQCARGDYEGCSPELELAYSHYLALAERAFQRKAQA